MFDLTRVNWSRLYYFYLVGQCRNITTAARYANIDQSGMSRHMMALEKELGVELLLRSRDGVTFTEIGEEVYRTVAHMAELSNDANERVEKIQNDMSGTLKILTTQGITRKYTDHLPEFYKKFPNIHLKFNVSRNYNDSNKLDGNDIAILPKFIEKEEMDYIFIGKQKLGIFASKGYLKKHGTPQNFEDLDNHKLISFSPDTLPSLGFLDFHLTIGRKNKEMREAYLQLGAADSLLRACEKDMGIIIYVDGNEFPLPDNFVRLFDGKHSESLDFHFIFSKKLKDTGKIKGFIDFFDKHW